MPSVIYIQSFLYQYFTIGSKYPTQHKLSTVNSEYSFSRFCTRAFPRAPRVYKIRRAKRRKKISGATRCCRHNFLFFSFFLDLKCSRQLITIATFESYVSRKSYHKSWLRNVTLICNYVILCTLN